MGHSVSRCLGAYANPPPGSAQLPCDNRRQFPRIGTLAPLDHPTVFVALVLGIVEGLTEFLPISSTGHLIVAGSLLGYVGDEAKVFELAIQSGAMLAIVWEYRARFARVLAGALRDRASQRFIVNIAIAFLPA